MSVSTRVIFKAEEMFDSNNAFSYYKVLAQRISTQSFQQGKEVDPVWRMS